MKTIQLTPIDSRKSFYNKCRVEQFKTKQGHCKEVLYSYDTKICVWNDTNYELIWLAKPEHLTATTNRHINAFLDCLGKPTMSKKELLKAIS